VKKYDLLASVLDITEQIHGEFGAAAIRNGLESKNTYLTKILVFFNVFFL
jgi:hypothetical protein